MTLISGAHLETGDFVLLCWTCMWSIHFFFRFTASLQQHNWSIVVNQPQAYWFPLTDIELQVTVGAPYNEAPSVLCESSPRGVDGRFDKPFESYIRVWWNHLTNVKSNENSRLFTTLSAYAKMLMAYLPPLRMKWLELAAVHFETLRKMIPSLFTISNKAPVCFCHGFSVLL